VDIAIKWKQEVRNYQENIHKAEKGSAAETQGTSITTRMC
jgi:hypothetical protein